MGRFRSAVVLMLFCSGLAGCATAPVTAPVSDYSAGYADGWADGRADAWDEAYAAGEADAQPKREPLTLTPDDLKPCNRNIPWMNSHGGVSQETALWSNDKAERQITACADKNEHKAKLLRQWAEQSRD